MICPYAVSRIITTHTTYQYDENQMNVGATTVETNNAKFVPCAKEDCGAYKDGQCCYMNSK